VNEERDVVGNLGDAGVLAGVRWAYRSAVSRTLEDYSEADGHDATWLGITRFTLFRNRLDRVFACERYAVEPPEADSDLDVLYEELSDDDVDAMPRLAPGVVIRSDLNGSPGWAHGQRRFLLASCVFGDLDQLPWPRKSATKQRVAQQPSPDPAPQGSLFDGLAADEVGGLQAVRAGGHDLDTFVVAHSLDPVSYRSELVIGRPRLNASGGAAWHWRHDLLDLAPVGGGRRTDDVPSRVDPSDESDAPVRLRRPAGEDRDVRGAAGGGGRAQ
jgi:hypothetical protein